MHTLASGNFVGEERNVSKLVHWVYSKSRGFVDLGDMADSYNISRGLKTFFPPAGPIPNAFIIHKSCGLGNSHINRFENSL